MKTMNWVCVLAALSLGGCQENAPATGARVSGQVDATEVQVAAEVGGRVIEMPVAEGDRLKQGDVIARLDTRDVELALQRAQAERAQADAQLRLLQAGARPEDIRQAEGAGRGRGGRRRRGADRSRRGRDRPPAIRKAPAEQLRIAETARRRGGAKRRGERSRQVGEGREAAAREGVARLRAGARREEIEAARARVAAVDAQIATLEKARADAVVRAPIDGIVSERLLDPGEMVAPRAPLVILTDLDHAWAEVFVDEPQVPKIKLGQPATVFTDAGGPGLPGKVSFIASKAEFTPRNVQTAEDRSKLVYRVKIAVDNRQGVLKQGMPVEAEIPVQ